MSKKIGLKLALLLSLAAGAKAYGVTTETPPANTDIGNQAYVSYFTEANVQKYLQSNIVITRINSIYNLYLTPDRETTLTRGSTAVFNHTLTNTGNIVDSYLLSHDYDARAISVYIDSNNNGVLDAGETKLTANSDGKYEIKNVAAGGRVSLLVTVPTAADEANNTVVGHLTAQSKGNPYLVDNIRVTETITFQEGGNAIVYKALDKASGTSENATEITVYLKIANDDVANSVSTLTLTDVLDPKFTYVPGSAKWTNYVGYKTDLTDIADGAEPGDTENEKRSDFSYDSTSHTVNFSLLTGIPANSQLNGNSNGILEFKVVVPTNTATGTIPNVANFTFKPSGSIQVTNRKSNTVSYEVLKYVRATFEGHHIPTGQAGETLRFVNKFTNTANASERYSITLSDEFFPTGTTFRLAMEAKEGGTLVERPILDTNGDGKIDTGLVLPGTDNSVNVILYATLPTNMSAPGSNYKIVKNATSTFTPTYVVKANDTVGTVSVTTVDLTNNFSLSEQPTTAPGLGLGPERNPVTQINLNPGATGAFVLHVNNTSSYVQDQYTLEVSTKADFSDMTLPAGVVVKFKQGGGAEVTRTGVILPNGSQRIDAEVTVASTAGAAVVPLYFRVTSLTTGARDIKYDSLSINAIRSVQIIPNLTGETYAGGNIVYTHQVRNNGNVLEGDGIASSVILSTHESIAQWRTELFLDVNKNGIYEVGTDIPFIDFATVGGLKAGEQVTIFSKVYAPIGAVAGSTNVTTITPNVTQGTYSTVPTVTSATDSTKVLAEKLSIAKQQRLSPTGAWTYNLQNANPGDKIYYKIQVRNTGSDNANTIQLKDTVPFHTTITYSDVGDIPKYEVFTAAGVLVTSGPILTKPAEGTRGELVVDLPTLEAGNYVNMYFTVKINGSTPVVTPPVGP